MSQSAQRAPVPRLAPGTRVRLRGRGVAYTLATPTGTIVRPDPLWDDHWIVRLDVPAAYQRADGGTEPLPELREAADNLIALPE